MRCLAIGLGLFALSACASLMPPDRAFPVFFTEFSATLDATGQAAVANAAATANKFPLLAVKVTGYVDSTGSAAGDIALSRARADAVAMLLEQDGVSRSRIMRAGLGTPPNSQPGVERRRVEIDIGAP